MLILPRKKNESIVIGDGIVLTVVEVRGDKVRLGIVAPPNVPVHRQEIYDAIRGFAQRTWPAPPPTPVDGPDVLPDLIVECRLARGTDGAARFDAEGGFQFPDN